MDGHNKADSVRTFRRLSCFATSRCILARPSASTLKLLRSTWRVSRSLNVLQALKRYLAGEQGQHRIVARGADIQIYIGTFISLMYVHAGKHELNAALYCCFKIDADHIKREAFRL